MSLFELSASANLVEECSSLIVMAQPMGIVEHSKSEFRLNENRLNAIRPKSKHSEGVSLHLTLPHVRFKIESVFYD